MFNFWRCVHIISSTFHIQNSNHNYFFRRSTLQLTFVGCRRKPISYVLGSQEIRSNSCGGKSLNFCTTLVRNRNRRDLAKFSATQSRVPVPKGKKLKSKKYWCSNYEIKTRLYLFNLCCVLFNAVFGNRMYTQ